MAGDARSAMGSAANKSVFISQSPFETHFGQQRGRADLVQVSRKTPGGITQRQDSADASKIPSGLENFYPGLLGRPIAVCGPDEKSRAAANESRYARSS